MPQFVRGGVSCAGEDGGAMVVDSAVGTGKRSSASGVA